MRLLGTIYSNLAADEPKPGQYLVTKLDRYRTIRRGRRLGGASRGGRHSNPDRPP